MAQGPFNIVNLFDRIIWIKTAIQCCIQQWKILIFFLLSEVPARETVKMCAVCKGPLSECPWCLDGTSCPPKGCEGLGGWFCELLCVDICPSWHWALHRGQREGYRQRWRCQCWKQGKVLGNVFAWLCLTLGSAQLVKTWLGTGENVNDSFGTFISFWVIYLLYFSKIFV